MKRALIIVIAAIGLVAWLVLVLRDKGSVATAARKAWPGGMGTLEVDNRWPKLEANGAAVTLESLASGLP